MVYDLGVHQNGGTPNQSALFWSKKSWVCYGSGLMGLGIWVRSQHGPVYMGPNIWVLAYGSLQTGPCIRVRASGSAHTGPNIRVPTSGSQHPGPGIWVPYDFIWHQNCQVRLPGPGIWVPYDLIGLSKLSGPLTGSWDPGPGTRVPCQGTTLL